jgi:hypothetical protein
MSAGQPASVKAALTAARAANSRPTKPVKGRPSQLHRGHDLQGNSLEVPLTRAQAERRSQEIAEMNTALNDVRGTLFQAMGIVRMSVDTIREPPLGERSITAAWTALDAAHEILCRVADRLQDSETMLADEVPHGDY